MKLGVRDFVAAAPVVVTILATSYVIYKNTVKPYDEKALLSWVLVILGLLALGEIVERYSTLLSIEHRLSALSRSSEKMAAGQVAEIFLKDRNAFPSFSDRTKNAKQIWLLGTSLDAMVAYHYG